MWIMKIVLQANLQIIIDHPAKALLILKITLRKEVLDPLIAKKILLKIITGKKKDQENKSKDY